MSFKTAVERFDGRRRVWITPIYDNTMKVFSADKIKKNQYRKLVFNQYSPPEKLFRI